MIRSVDWKSPGNYGLVWWWGWSQEQVMKCWSTEWVSPVRSHVSCVMWHVSCVMCHVSLSAGVLSECHLWGVTDLMPGPGAGEWAPSPETRRRSVSWCDGRGLEETERLILASPPPGPGTLWRPQISALRKTDVSCNTFLFSPTTLWFSLSPCDSIFHPRTLS